MTNELIMSGHVLLCCETLNRYVLRFREYFHFFFLFLKKPFEKSHSQKDNRTYIYDSNTFIDTTVVSYGDNNVLPLSVMLCKSIMKFYGQCVFECTHTFFGGHSSGFYYHEPLLSRVSSARPKRKFDFIR